MVKKITQIDVKFTLWMMTLTPIGRIEDLKGSRFESEKKKRFKKFKENGLIGVGWPIQTKVQSVNEAERSLKQEYPDKGDQTEKPIRFLKEVNPGDLIWVYGAEEHQHFLCKVKSDWEQRIGLPWNSEEKPMTDANMGLGIGWVRQAEWQEIGLDKVPGPITRNGRVATLIEKDKDPFLKEYSRQLFEGTLPEHHDLLSCRLELATLDLNHLGFESMEDIVCNYIQSLGWRLIKSSASASHRDFECKFRKSSEPDPATVAYIQVKTGKASIDAGECKTYEDLLVKDPTAKIFLYLSDNQEAENKKNGLAPTVRDRVIIIRDEDLKDYLSKNLSELDYYTLYSLKTQSEK